MGKQTVFWGRKNLLVASIKPRPKLGSNAFQPSVMSAPAQNKSSSILEFAIVKIGVNEPSTAVRPSRMGSVLAKTRKMAVVKTGLILGIQGGGLSEIKEKFRHL